LFTSFVSGCSRPNSTLSVFIRTGEKDGEAFLADWKSLLRERGAQVDGGTRVPPAKTLKKFEVLVLYTGEQDRLEPVEQSSIESFVREGGGLVLLHGALRSADAQWWMPLAGGGWDPGESKARRGAIALYFGRVPHPITEKAESFELADELLYQLRVAPEAKVLARSFQSAKELTPQIWAYEKGQTRAAVCLPGQNAEALAVPQLRALVLRSIAWAGNKPVDLLASKTELASLEHPAGGPQVPQESLKRLKAQPEFALSLIAAEPLLNSPTYMDWDPGGRMWVSVAVTAEKGHRTGAVIILDDANQDGVVDEKHVFAESPDLLSSFVFYRDGIIAAQNSEIVWLRDTDGDGVADKRESIFMGFAPERASGTINNLRWGLDGWIYGALGEAGAAQKVVNAAGKQFRAIESGLFRFQPDGSSLEMVSIFKGNSRGLDFTWDGEIFFSRQGGSHVSHVMMPEKYLARARVPKATSEKVIEDHQKVNSLLTNRPMEYLVSTNGQFATASGFMVYQGGTWPLRYGNSCLVCEPAANVVHQDIISTLVEGSIGYEAARAGKEEFLAATDPWFRPINARYGPDGAVYVIDSYDQFGPRDDERSMEELTGTTGQPGRGRIWRLQHRQARKLPVPELAGASSSNLVSALMHPNAWVRMTAQRLLIERGETNVTRMLSTTMLTNRVPYVRVHALWTLFQLHTIRETNLIAGALDWHPGVQKNALRILSETGLPLSTNLEKAVLKQAKEADDRPRLNALFALQNGGLSKESRQSTLRHYADQKDLWSKSAYLGVAMSAPMDFTKEALAVEKGENLKDLVATLANHFVETGSLSNAVYLVERLARDGKKAGPSVLQGAILDSFTRAESPDFVPSWSPALEKAFKTLLDAESSTVRYNALALAKRWDKEKVLSKEMGAARHQLLTDLDELRKDDQRTRVISAVMSIPSLHEDMIPELEKTLGSGFSDAVQNHLVKEFARSEAQAVAPVLIKHFRNFNPEGRQLAMGTLLRRHDWVESLVDAIAEKKFRDKDLSVLTVDRLRHYPDPALAAKANEAVDLLKGPANHDKAGLVTKFQAAFAKPADLKNGSEMFKSQCAHCHRIGEKDREKDKLKELGPELNGIGVLGSTMLLTRILDPNRFVETNAIPWNITTKNGDDYYGLIVSENKETIKIRTLDAEPEIRVPEVASRKLLGRSLMPEGWEALGEKNIRDIVGYLIEKSSKIYQTLDLTPAFTADSRKGLYSEPSDKPSLDFSRFGLVTIDRVPFEIVNPSALHAGKNVVVLKGGAGFAKTLPQRVEIPVGTRASVIHVLGGVAGWGYPNGKAGETNEPVVRAQIQYADGESEEVVFRNGKEFADYTRRIDVPGSRYVSDLVAEGQIRLFTFEPARTNEISKIVLESYNGGAAPTFVAMTAQLGSK
jgi:putative membrane-bound dehydrogenase-like protein